MKNKFILAASIALAFSAALTPGFARAQSVDNAQAATTQMTTAPGAQAMAAQMVPAEAVLADNIDARKMQPGQPIRATLSETVHLKNGTELPKGTALMGTIATDNTQGGESKNATLALRFTQAQVKGGQTIPIQATVVGVAGPEYGEGWGEGVSTPAPLPWNGNSLAIDEVGALGGIDLHSRIAGDNSAVFVAAHKNDLKLKQNTQLSLAIGASGAGQMNGGE